MKKGKHIHRNGILLMIIAALFFSFMGALVKFATQRLPSSEAVFFRALVSVIIIFPIMLRKRVSFVGNNVPILLLRSAVGFTALCLSFYVTSKIKLADASILNHTSILFVAMLSAVFLKEKVTLNLVIYIVCALIGAVMIVKPQLDVVNIPGLLGLASGFFAAIAYICIKKLHKTDSFFTIVFYFASFSALLSFVLFHHQFILPTGHEWIALIGLGLCGTIAQLLMTYSYKYTDASIVNPYNFTAVLFSATWGGIFWKEILDGWSIMGGVLIIACGIGIMRLKKARGETAIEYEEDWGDQSENKA